MANIGCHIVEHDVVSIKWSFIYFIILIGMLVCLVVATSGLYHRVDSDTSIALLS